MDGLQFDDIGSSRVFITVLSVTPVRAGKLFAFASAEIDIELSRGETPSSALRTTSVARSSRDWCQCEELAASDVRPRSTQSLGSA